MAIRLKLIFISLFLLACIGLGSAQNLVINRGGGFIIPYEKYAFCSGKNIHTSTLPYSGVDFSKRINDSIDSVIGFPKAYDKLLNWFLNKPFAQKRDSNSSIIISPIVELGASLGIKGGSRLNYELALGLNLTGTFRKRISYMIQGIGFHGKYQNYLANYISQNKVIPGTGYAYGNGVGGKYNTYNLSGFIAYSPTNYFTATLGHGKHFVGDGYRSLLLSSNSNNYNYLKLDVTFWKLKYWVLYTRMTDISASAGQMSKFVTKYATIHYLDILIGNRFSFGAFESVVWENKNQDGSIRGFDVQYLNPFIFFRPVEYSLGSPDNALLGVNLRARFLKRQVFYIQAVLDELVFKEVIARNGWWANKQGFQVGLKGYDLLGTKGLYYQGEVNYVRPYTYTHYRIPQNYANFNQPLAHPLGTNFMEAIGRLIYQRGKHSIETKLIYAIYGTDVDSVNYGGNMFKPYTSRPSEYGNRVAQGLKNTTIYTELKYSVLINRKWNFMFETGLAVRMNKTILNSTNEAYFNVGFRTCLPARYMDF